MSYDFVIWKQKRNSIVSPAVVYLALAEGLPCDATAAFPVDKVVAVLRDDFGDAFEDELQATIDKRHFSANLSWNDGLEDAVGRLRAMAARLRLVFFDPQVTSPSDDEMEQFRALEARAIEESKHEMFGAWVQLAEEGDLTAMNELGNCYAFGDGVRQDDVVAVHWYRRAAAGGFAPALMNLAECYRTGSGVAYDPEEAIRLFIAAGEAGLGQAFLDLAAHFRSGSGVPQDAGRAVELYEWALTTEPCVSAFELGDMYEHGDGVVQSIDRAAEYYALARKNRHPEAYLALKRLGRAPEE